MELEKSACRWCGLPIVMTTFGQMGGWEPDYDLSDDPITWRHEWGYAACGQHFAEPRPRIVTLCGSTRFYDTFQRINYEQTMAGDIILSVGFYPHSMEQAHGEQVGVTPKQKIELDVLHKRKIDLSDAIIVLNVGGYIGDSTRSEIAHAEATGKPVGYLEPTGEED